MKKELNDDKLNKLIHERYVRETTPKSMDELRKLINDCREEIAKMNRYGLEKLPLAKFLSLTNSLKELSAEIAKFPKLEEKI